MENEITIGRQIHINCRRQLPTDFCLLPTAYCLLPTAYLSLNQNEKSNR